MKYFFRLLIHFHHANGADAHVLILLAVGVVLICDFHHLLYVYQL